MKSKDKDLYDIWIQQQNYNDDINREQPRTAAERMQNYVLGTISELGELLEEIRWKQHRISKAEDFGFNTAEELADITKYVISMWQVLGYTPKDLFHWVYEKGRILEQLKAQETRIPPSGRKILMLDLDGCIADFRQGFGQWLKTSRWEHTLPIGPEDYGLHLDINNGWDFASYNRAKVEFEADGGYYGLPPMITTIGAVKELHLQGWYIIVYTARPFTQYKRIWGDTWRWLQDYELWIDELHFGFDKRIEIAQDLSINNTVVAMEDDPILIERYLLSKIPVVAIPQPYNTELQFHPLLHKVYEEDADWTIIQSTNTLAEIGAKNHV